LIDYSTAHQGDLIETEQESSRVTRTRIALWIWYRGEFFRGFQAQAKGPTVQDSIAHRLRAIGIRSSPCPAGRTDKGVHARMQVLSLRSAPVAPDELFHRLSDPAPSGWGICCARSARDGFHAQWSSVGKQYRYRLRLDPRADAPWEPYSWSPSEHPRLAARKLDVACLAGVLRALEGTRDFSAFHESSSSRGLRTIHRAELVESAGGVLDIRIRGDRFGRHQIRFMVGAAAAVAAGALAKEALLRSIEEAVPLPGVKAPARGLVLWDVHYPATVDPFDANDRLRSAALPPDPPFSALTV